MTGLCPSRRRIAAPAFAALIALAVGCAAAPGRPDEKATGGGTISGRIVLDGDPPRSWRADSDTWLGGRDAPPRGWDGRPPSEIEVDASGGVRGVAIWLEPKQGEREAKAELAPEPVTVLMKGSCFWPMMAVVASGASVRFVNADARLHHVEFLSRRARSGVKVGPGESVEVKFEEPDQIRMTCNDHAFMRADLVVTPGIWSAATDAMGRFEITGVPKGRYRVRFAHHRLKEAGDAQEVQVDGEGDSRIDLRASRGKWAY